MYRLPLAAIAVMLSLSAAAFAGSADRPSSIARQPNAPIVLRAAQTRIYNGLNGEPKFFFNLCLAYDAPAKPVHTIRYRIDALDGFHAQISSVTIDDNGQPADGTLDRMLVQNRGLGTYVEQGFTKCWGTYNRFPETTDSFVVSVDAVSFEDGTIWRTASRSK